MSVCVLGSINLDIVCQVEALPRPGETVASPRVRRFPGGKGLNQAVAAARWGAATVMIGAVGADAAGAELTGYLAAAGADVSGVRVLPSAPTGCAYILVSDAGENMIVVAGGANLAITAADVAPAPHRVYLAQLETPAPAIAALFEHDAARAGLRILTAAPAALEAAALFPRVDILILNETELASFAGAAASPSSPDEAAAMARRLSLRPDQSVIVTLGAAGAIAVTKAGVSRAPGIAVGVVDTTGAGDCFCGVLAAALDEGADLARAMTHANAAAALSAKRAGAAASIPTRAETEAFIARHV